MVPLNLSISHGLDSHSSLYPRAYPVDLPLDHVGRKLPFFA